MRLLKAALLLCTLFLLVGAPSALAQPGYDDPEYHDPEYNEVANVVLGDRFSRPEPPKPDDFPLGTSESAGGLAFTGADLAAVILSLTAIGTGILLVRARRAQRASG